MNVIVYSKPRCVQCEATIREMEKLGIQFEYKDVSEAPELGYRSAPIVVAGDTHWSGFRPDLIKALQ